MVRFLITLSFLAILLLPLSSNASPSWWESELSFVNSSDYDIHHIYLSSTDEFSWGPDQLRNDVLESGAEVEFTGIDCDDYDIKLIDEDGDECVLEDVDLCLEDQAYEITNSDLIACEWAS